MATVRARYEKGVLTPLEPLEIEDGAEVIVAVERTVVMPQANGAAEKKDLSPEEATALFESSFGGWKDIIPDDFAETIRQARIDGSRTPPTP